MSISFMEWTKRAAINKYTLCSQEGEGIPSIKDVYIETHPQHGRLAKFLAHDVLYNTGMAEDYDSVLVSLKYRPHQSSDIQVEVYVDQVYDKLMTDYVLNTHRGLLDQLLVLLKKNNAFYHAEIQECMIGDTL